MLLQAVNFTGYRLIRRTLHEMRIMLIALLLIVTYSDFNYTVG